MKFTVIAIGRNYTLYPYLNKLLGVLKNNGSVEYLYWDRKVNSFVDLNYDVSSTPIFSRKVNGRFSLFFSYFMWVFAIFRYLLKFKNSETIYFASRFDVAFALYLYSKLDKKLKFVYLDRDCYHMTYNLGVFKSLVKFIEGVVAKSALFHLVPGKSRNYTRHNNVVVVSNTPSYDSYMYAIKKSNSLFKSQLFTIYINGWLVESRGAKMIMNTIRELSKSQFAVRVLIAGPIECKNIEKIINFEIVEYLGELSSGDSLAYYFVSDLVLAFYDPRIDINRYAEPNKWFDCLFTNTKFVTNKGLETSRIFVESGIALEVEYNNHFQLCDIIVDLINQKEVESPPSCRDFKSLGFDYWDVHFDLVVKQILDKSEVVNYVH